MNDELLVWHLVQSWPNLTTLILPVDHVSISLLTLGIIAENCPELRYLQIQLDASTIPPFNNPASAVLCKNTNAALCHKLGVLSVAHDPYTARKLQGRQVRHSVARYLDSMFPLVSIEMLDESNPAIKTWSEVYELMRLFQDVRREANGQE
ncbi:hypothetical protein BYT27DRAFT_7261409 [Phlegmacium glaucopus]|nr:hypothetical protein BYT27DRAFT_7261409 [Phlegmacium glaucopus]